MTTTYSLAESTLEMTREEMLANLEASFTSTNTALVPQKVTIPQIMETQFVNIMNQIPVLMYGAVAAGLGYATWIFGFDNGPNTALLDSLQRAQEMAEVAELREQLG
jgi:hypothetical protein